MGTIFSLVQEHYIITGLVTFMMYIKWQQRNMGLAMENIEGSLVKKISTDEEWKEMCKASEGKIIIVDFYATWCPPCATAAPVFAKMSQEFSSYKSPAVELWKVDVDGSHNISKSQGISAMPTFKFFRSSGGSLIELETVRGWSESNLRASTAKYSTN